MHLMRWVGDALMLMLVPLSQALTRVKDAEETANTISLDFDFICHTLMSPSVSYEVLINTLWWS